MVARRSYVGNAPATTLASGLSAGVFTFTVATGEGANFPTGAGGDFFVCIDQGLSSEEKIRCSSRSGDTFTVLASTGRGADDTSDTTHDTGAAVIHCVTALDLDEANRHISDTAQDDHTQYMDAAGVRHDLTARHAFGSALGTPGTPAAVAAAGATGSGSAPAREDHVHAAPADIAGDGLAATGTVLSVNVDDTTIETTTDTLNVKALGIDTAQLAADAVTNAKIGPGAVDTTELAADAVDGTKLADNAVDSEHYTDGSIDREHLATNLHPTQTCTSGARPSTPAAGWIAYETDTKRTIVYDAVAASWKYLNPRIQVEEFSITFSSGTGTGTITFGTAFTNTPVVLGHKMALITANTPFAVGFKLTTTTKTEFVAKVLDGGTYSGTLAGNTVTVADYTDVIGYEDF